MTRDELDLINWNNYLISGTNVLKNKLGITNEEELKVKEKAIVKRKLAYLYLQPMKGNFDIEHLQKIHKFIFNDIYAFAGELRNCSLQKDDHIFCYPNEIRLRLIEILKTMNSEFSKDINSINEFAFKLAPFYFELISIHPFREGNGRTIRVFIRDFVREKSVGKTCGELDLDYTKINKINLMLGTAQRYVFRSYIEVEFMQGLVPVEKEKSIKI